jgi:hypothetical protein
MASSEIQYGDPVTDPELLRQLNGATPQYGDEVADPALLAKLNGAQSVAGWADVGKGLRAGLTHDFPTGIAETPYYAGDLLRRGLKWAGFNPQQPTNNQPPTPEQVEGWWQKNAPSWAQAYEPTTRAGRVAETAGGFIPSLASAPSAIRGAGGLIPGLKEAARQLTGKVALPTAGTEAGGAGAAAINPDFENYGRALGGTFANPVIARAITPAPRTRAQNIDFSQLPTGVRRNLTGAQTSDQRGLMTGVQSVASDEAAMGALNKHYMNIAGASPDNIVGFGHEGNLNLPKGGTAIDANARRIGKEMDRITAANDFHDDPQMWNEASKAKVDYNNGPIDPHNKDYIDRLYNGLQTELGKQQIMVNGQPVGWLSGPRYQQWSSQTAAAARRLSSDPAAQHAVYQIRNAVDDAYERALTRNQSADVGALKTARQQWRANLAIDQAMDYRQNSIGAEGWIRPDYMQAAARQVYGTADPARNPFETVSRAAFARNIGIKRAEPIPGFISRILGGEGPLIGGLAAEDIGHAAQAGAQHAGFLPGAITTAGMQHVAQALGDRPFMRALSRNQLLPNRSIDPIVALYAQTMLGGNSRPRITVTPSGAGTSP